MNDVSELKTPRRATVAVIGAGPSGLALARELRRRGVSFVILEKGNVGESWNRMPTHLKLVSPWKTNWLTRDSARCFSPNAQLTRAEFLAYLMDFARQNELPIVTGCEVRSVEKIGEEFQIQTSRGEFRADVVVNAAGYFSAPLRPEVPGSKTARFPQLHYAEFSDAGQVVSAIGPNGSVLIVGHRLSAGQTALELFDAGLRVALSHRTPIRFGVGEKLWPFVYRNFARVEWLRLKLGIGIRRKIDVPMAGGRGRKLIESGAIKTFPAVARIDGANVVFEDKTTFAPDIVIYATGFCPNLSFLTLLHVDVDSCTGVPVTHAMESVSVPGLFFIGFESLRNFQSRFLRGIRNDAVVLAEQIAARVTGLARSGRNRCVRSEEAHARATPDNSRLTATFCRLFRLLLYYARVPVTWTALTLHNTWGILNVLDIIWLRPMRGGLIDEHHPFCTGVDPASGELVWHRNLVFRSTRREEWANDALVPDCDEEILRKVGDHLRKQVLMAARTTTHPNGHAAPMPPGILYIHGGVHFNGVWLLFNDFADAIRHFSDPTFSAEFRRLVREEKREPITLFRDRDYDRTAFARYVCFMRTIFPWFSNCNGPKKFVLWGNPSPYPAVNTITGNWIRETRALKTEQGRATVARAPVARKYFQQGAYFGERETTRWPENLLALLTDKRIALRGERENLYFVDKRKIRRGFRFGPNPILSPLQRFLRWWKHDEAPTAAESEKPVNQTPA